MVLMEKRTKYKKEQFHIQTQISHVTARAYDGEKLDKNQVVSH